MKLTRLLPLVLLCVLLGGGCLPAWTDPPRSGTVLVPASIDGTGATDVTAAFDVFIDKVPADRVVELGRNARYRIEGGLKITWEHGLTIHGNGATIFATTTGTTNRSNLSIQNSTDIVITDLHVVGANPHAGLGEDAYVPTLGGQHAFDVRTSDGVSLVRVTGSDTYGDFVYLGKMEKSAWSNHIVIRDSTFARSGRQGMSMTAAHNVIIDSNSLSEIHRAAFDFEPIAAGFGVDHVVIRDNTIGSGTLRFVAAVSYGPVDQITIEHNTLPNRPLSIEMEELSGLTRYDWKVIDNTAGTVYASTAKTVMSFQHIDGLEVSGNSQEFLADRQMIGAIVTNGCRTSISGNHFPGAMMEGQVNGVC
jgi:Right handed beta helix region